MLYTLDLHFMLDEVIAAYVLESTDGLILIETGPHSVFSHLEEGLQEIGFRVEDVRHVLLTHIHFDHAGAAWALAAQNATIYVHPAGYKHLHSPERLYESAKRIYGAQMESLWGDMNGIEEERLFAVKDKDVLRIGDQTLTAWHTPGHAKHHIAWQWGKALFTGDVAGCKIAEGPVVPPCPPPDIDLEAWHNSISVIRKIAPETLYLTHYGQVSQIDVHLKRLEEMLADWSNWVKVRMEAGKDIEEMTAAFQQYTDNQLREVGIDERGVKQYGAANPAWMSVAGLVRYWNKKESSEN